VHQAYDVSYFGKPMETGPSAIDGRLWGTSQSLITLEIDASIATAQTVGDLTQGLIVTGAINHSALGAGRTIALTLPAWKGDGAVTLTTALSITAAGLLTLTGPIFVPLTQDRPLQATIAAGTAGQKALISLIVAPIGGGWF